MGNISISKQMQKTHYSTSTKFKLSTSRTKGLYRAGETSWCGSDLTQPSSSISEPFVLKGTSQEHPVHVPVQAEAEQVVHGHIQLGFPSLQPSLWVTRSRHMSTLSQQKTTHGAYSKAQRLSRGAITWLVTQLLCVDCWCRKDMVWKPPAAVFPTWLFHKLSQRAQLLATACSPHQPGATALKGQAVPNQGCRMGQWPTFPIPNTAKL